jgi:hydroxymethylglutaryl-CoA reductase (NADPH)
MKTVVQRGEYNSERKGKSEAVKRREKVRNALASDALPLPVGLTNKIFIVLFFVASYFLMRSWRDKIRNSTPLHMLNLGEIVALLIQLASFIYLIGFFGIDYVQGFIGKSGDGAWDSDDEREQKGCQVQPEAPKVPVQLMGMGLGENEDEDIARAVSNGEVPSYSLETQLRDSLRGAAVRRRAVEMASGRSLEGLPLAGMDYSSIMGQCCEMVVGYVQVPVGVAGPLLLNGHEFTVPMATTEGCLVASTNRGCKAIYQSGGATSILLQDGMTRAPVVRFPSVKRCADLKFFVEDPNNFDTISHMFNRYFDICFADPVFRALLFYYWYLELGSPT